LLNFSKKYLSVHRGARQDACLVLSTNLIPSEVDDMVFDMDMVWEYPLEFYEVCEKGKMPWDIKIEQLNDNLGSEKQFEKYGFTHDVSSINYGIRYSNYKFLPTMQEKVQGQMDIAERVRAVDTSDVARLVIEKHFIRDIKGNLRKFSMQKFRCVNCNEKYRRPPLVGRCLKCPNGKIIFTISEGSVTKYLEPSLNLAEKYDLPVYLQQTLEIAKKRIEHEFGKDPEKQEGLGKWF
jgi:DNA polymerase II large subunit